ncbi:hypothetical protein BDR04DRAFT_1091236 [Suillus decipiens]|nr:hypothetical protein BDR04DRAFT_1091236 [Suillus decipiens]
MPIDTQHIDVPYLPPYDQFRPPNPAKGQRKGRVRSFLPSFVDRAIFRAKPAAHRDAAELHPEVDPATNVDSLATKSHILHHLPAQIDRTETQKSEMANRGLRSSPVTNNKEQNAAPQALDNERCHSRAHEPLNLDRKAMQSGVCDIIQSHDFNLHNVDELNMRQGARVIKPQSKLFDQDEHITLPESSAISNHLVETVACKTIANHLEGTSQADTGSQGWVTEVQAIAEPQSMKPPVVVKRNSTTKQELERREKLAKRQRNIAHDMSGCRNFKDDDPFASEPNLAPHRRIRNVLADARDRTLATISEMKDVRRKKDERQPSQACRDPQTEFTAFRDIRGLLADLRECARTQMVVSGTKDTRPKKDGQRPSKACHGHQAEFAAYQDQIAVLTSERDMLSRELKRSTRMADSNAFLLNSVELQAQRLLSEHDALIVEHQQEKARSQQRIRKLESRLEETTMSASRTKERYEAEHEQLLEELKLERIQSAQNHGDHLDETLILFRENAEQANLIKTLNRNLAEHRTMLQKVHIKLDLANDAQAIMKRKLQIVSQQAQENVELLHSTPGPPKAQGSIFRSLRKRLSRNGPRQVLHQGSQLVTQEIVKGEKAQPPVASTGTSSSPPTSVYKVSGVTQEIVKNEKAQPPVAATGTSSLPPTSVHKIDGVTSQHARRMLSGPPENPPVAEPPPRDPPKDNLDISKASIFSDNGVDLLLEPSKDVIGEGNGLANLCSMLSVVCMYAPSPIRGPLDIQPRRRNVDPFKILVHPDDIAKTDGVANWSLFHL